MKWFGLRVPSDVPPGYSRSRRIVRRQAARQFTFDVHPTEDRPSDMSAVTKVSSHLYEAPAEAVSNCVSSVKW